MPSLFIKDITVLAGIIPSSGIKCVTCNSSDS